jgi:glycosyltransferase involved in cell wall biosynthesis
MKNICFVHCVDVIGGAERVSQAIMRGLCAKENKLYLTCPAIGELTQECNEYQVTPLIHNIQQPDFKHPIKTLKSNVKWKGLIESNHIDTFHTGDLLSTRSLIKTAKKNGVKIVCHIHFPFKQSFASWVFNERDFPDAFIFCSQELQDDVGPMLSDLCPKSVQWVIHNGVDINKFAPAPSSKEKEEKEKEKTIRIGIVANLQYRKGHDEFLKMAKVVNQHYPKTHFDIIGGDIMEEPREGILKQMARSLGIEKHVTFHGQVSNVKELIDELDIYVCASHEEAFPISILEAMACGKAIVSTNVNGIPEALIDGSSGLLVESKNHKQLSSAVLKVIEDSSLKLTLETQARARVEEHFSEAVFIDKVNDLYASLHQ